MKKPLPLLQNYSLLKQKAMRSVFDSFDQLAEGCLIVDREARVVMINDRYAARLGVDPAKVIGQEIESFLPNSLMRQVVVTGKPTLLSSACRCGMTTARWWGRWPSPCTAIWKP